MKKGKNTSRFQMHLQDKEKWQRLADIEGNGLSELIHIALNEYSENHGLESRVCKMMDSISNVMTEMEITRDYMPQIIVKMEEQDLYSVLCFCYDLLAKTDYVSNIKVPAPEQIDDDSPQTISKYSGSTYSYLEEVYEKLITKK